MPLWSRYLKLTPRYFLETPRLIGYAKKELYLFIGKTRKL